MVSITLIGSGTLVAQVTLIVWVILKVSGTLAISMDYNHTPAFLSDKRQPGRQHGVQCQIYNSERGEHYAFVRCPAG